MVTEAEEIQAKDFLKRAEIRTMRKDLLKLREADSLKERDKIAQIRTLDEQLADKQKADLVVPSRAAVEKIEREKILEKNEGQERVAEKDLKNYATEQERQQIFLLESQRLGFEKQVDAIDKDKDPALKLEKNKLLLQKRDLQEKLNLILEQEKKLEDEQKFVINTEQTTAIASQKKSLEQSRWDLDKKIQEVEKKRWAVEKQIEDTDTAVNQIDSSSENLVIEKNGLRDKILGLDKSLRDIYSVVMVREEERIKGEAQEQILKKEALAKVRGEQKEKIQREQWSPNVPKKQTIENSYSSQTPTPTREKIIQSSETENKQREKFLQDVETFSGKENQPRQASAVSPVPPVRIVTPPPVPSKK